MIFIKENLLFEDHLHMALNEQQLITWSSPVGTSEDQKCKNAISQVTAAIRAKFGTGVSVFLQGSYRNNTNVRQDSDVDIVVRHDGYFFPDLQRLNEEQKKIYHASHPVSSYTFVEFKNEIQEALRNTFTTIERKNKCIKIPGNSNRVNADVVPCFVMTRFATTTQIEAEGIMLNADDGKQIASFPEQHYTNGVAKRAATGHMYKKIVRILKKLKSELVMSGTISENIVSSFAIECLVYNVPNDHFIAGNYKQSLKNVITRLYNDMSDVTKGNEYVEVSGLKWLFKGTDRSMSDVKDFMLKCWQYGDFN